MIYTDEKIDELRQKVEMSMSEKRFFHTAEVEKMAERLGNLYVPDKILMLRAAALLHDITKEKSTEQQLELLKKNGVKITPIDAISPKTLHAKTAEYVIRDEFSEFYGDPELLDCVRKHTTGDAQMTICEMIIYLADYIDMSRKFDDCVKLREYFWGKDPEKMGEKEKYNHLLKTLILSFDMTLCALIEEGSPISRQSVDARNAMICNLKA
jgi:predicted HD superfamily hydrolase involved in NAD metabolism